MAMAINPCDHERFGSDQLIRKAVRQLRIKYQAIGQASALATELA
jgi:hypothetical protein